MIKAYLLYSGEDGHSHVKEGFLEENIMSEVKTISVKESSAGATFSWHNAPTTQYVICLSGVLEFATFTDEVFHLHPGEILIAMDTTGSGHTWKLVGKEPWRRAYVTFNNDTKFNFKEKDQVNELTENKNG
jgi:quercetin dioxygenase-like cupin family protein